MFKQACKDLTHWMYPVIFSSHNSDGTTESHLGAGILVNDDGWLLTAGHLVKKFGELKSSEQKYQQRFKDLQPKVAAIKAKKNLTAKQRQRKISSLYAKVPVSSTSVGFMFMVPTVGVSRGIVDEVVDLGQWGFPEGLSTRSWDTKFHYRISRRYSEPEAPPRAKCYVELVTPSTRSRRLGIMARKLSTWRIPIRCPCSPTKLWSVREWISSSKTIPIRPNTRDVCFRPAPRESKVKAVVRWLILTAWCVAYR